MCRLGTFSPSARTRFAGKLTGIKMLNRSRKIGSSYVQEKSGNYELGVKLAGITWMLATLIQVIGILATLILNYSLSNLILLILFILLTSVNFITHKKACEKCKMRFIYPASMTKSG